jgi:hypothetical protein
LISEKPYNLYHRLQPAFRIDLIRLCIGFDELQKHFDGREAGNLAMVSNKTLHNQMILLLSRHAGS